MTIIHYQYYKSQRRSLDYLYSYDKSQANLKIHYAKESYRRPASNITNRPKSKPKSNSSESNELAQPVKKRNISRVGSSAISTSDSHTSAVDVNVITSSGHVNANSSITSSGSHAHTNSTNVNANVLNAPSVVNANVLHAPSVVTNATNVNANVLHAPLLNMFNNSHTPTSNAQLHMNYMNPFNTTFNPLINPNILFANAVTEHHSNINNAIQQLQSIQQLQPHSIQPAQHLSNIHYTQFHKSTKDGM